MVIENLKSFYKNNENYKTFPGVNNQIVYETLTIPMPTFIEIVYSVGIICEYQQQMNQILAPFMAQTGAPSAFKIEYEGNKYETFIEPEATCRQQKSSSECKLHTKPLLRLACSEIFSSRVCTLVGPHERRWLVG